MYYHCDDSMGRLCPDSLQSLALYHIVGHKKKYFYFRLLLMKVFIQLITSYQLYRLLVSTIITNCIVSLIVIYKGYHPLGNIVVGNKLSTTKLSSGEDRLNVTTVCEY